MNALILLALIVMVYYLYWIHCSLHIVRTQITNILGDDIEHDEKIRLLFHNDKEIVDALNNHKDAIVDVYKRIGGRAIEISNYSEMTH